MCSVTQLCVTLCNPMDCSPPGSAVHSILQARILEWIAKPSSRRSSQPYTIKRASFSTSYLGSVLRKENTFPNIIGLGTYCSWSGSRETVPSRVLEPDLRADCALSSHLGRTWLWEALSAPWPWKPAAPQPCLPRSFSTMHGATSSCSWRSVLQHFIFLSFTHPL